MLQTLLNALLSAVLGVLAQWVQALIADLLSGPLDASFLERLYDIVFGVEQEQPGATGDEKYEIALSKAKTLRYNLGKEGSVDDSQLNTMIELAVRKMRQARAA